MVDLLPVSHPKVSNQKVEPCTLNKTNHHNKYIIRSPLYDYIDIRIKIVKTVIRLEVIS